MTPLKPGDVLSYSSGRQDHGPYGFRTLRRASNVMGVIQQHWPYVLQSFAGRLPLIINAYPASLGHFDFGVMVDSYLSLGTGSRAMHLAALEKMPVMLLGQPAYVADLMYRHLSIRPALPDTLILGVGGYRMPHSLQLALEEMCRQHLQHIYIVNGYGVAEVDSSCLLAVERDAEGELKYFPRDGVTMALNGERLSLSLVDPDGALLMDRFDTGDSARKNPDGSYHIWNDERLHPHVKKILESWSPKDWQRRTGYLYFGREIRFQLRKGVEPENAIECEFHDYMKRYGHSWLFKPEWGRMKDSDRNDPLRRTIL